MNQTVLARAVLVNEQMRQAYRDWLMLPMTQQVLALLQAEAVHGPLAIADPNSALLTCGKNEGWVGCINRAMTLDVQEQVQELPEATYPAPADEAKREG